MQPTRERRAPHIKLRRNRVEKVVHAPAGRIHFAPRPAYECHKPDGDMLTSRHKLDRAVVRLSNVNKRELRSITTTNTDGHPDLHHSSLIALAAPSEA